MMEQEKNSEKVVDLKNFSKRIWAHRAAIAASAAAVVVIILVCSLIIYISYVGKVYNGYEVINTVEREQVEAATVVDYGTNFLTYSADGIHCTDAKGSDIWSCPFEMQNPMVEVCGDYVAAADYNGRKIYVYNSSGELGAISTSNPIRAIKVSDKGVVVAVLDDTTVTPICLYYYDGSEIASFRTTMSKSGYPVALDISDDSKMVAISYLYLDSGTMTSKVAFYNFGEVGQNETDNLVSGYDYQSELVPVVEFMDNSHAFALANDRLIFYAGSQRPQSTANILLQEEVQSVYYSKDYVGLVYLNNTGESKFRMDIYSVSGELKSSLNFDIQYSDIFFTEDRAIIYNAASCVIYSTSGRLKYQGDFDESVLLMIPTTSSTKYVLVMPDRIETIQLQ